MSTNEQDPEKKDQKELQKKMDNLINFFEKNKDQQKQQPAKPEKKEPKDPDLGKRVEELERLLESQKETVAKLENDKRQQIKQQLGDELFEEFKELPLGELERLAFVKSKMQGPPGTPATPAPPQSPYLNLDEGKPPKTVKIRNSWNPRINDYDYI